MFYTTQRWDSSRVAMKHWLHHLVTVWVDPLMLRYFCAIPWFRVTMHACEIFLLYEPIFSLHELTRTFIVLKRLDCNVILVCIIGTVRIIWSWFQSAHWTFARLCLVRARLIGVTRAIFVIVIIAPITADAHTWTSGCVLLVTVVPQELTLDCLLSLTQLLLAGFAQKILIGRNYRIILSVVNWNLLGNSCCFVACNGRAILALSLLLFLLL